jgi:3-oxoacyl-[acyl-carrier protein] reductase
MLVTIFGAGAVGGTTGAALARAGHDVLLVDNSAPHVAAINAHGLTVERGGTATTIDAARAGAWGQVRRNRLAISGLGIVALLLVAALGAPWRAPADPAKQSLMRQVDEVSDADWRVIFEIDLDGAFHFTRAVVPGMKRAGGGAIVNISSGAGRSYSLTGIQAYASAKAGLLGFTRQTARELGAHRIRVNCVAPGFVRSNPASEQRWRAMGEEGQRRLVESIALRRIGTPEDIARAVVFFCSDDAGYVTGQTISVDGGMWMLG